MRHELIKIHCFHNAVGLDDGRPALAGLGWLRPIEGSPAITRRDTTWQWMQSDFGASFLVKRRESPRPLPDGNRPRRRNQEPVVSSSKRKGEDMPMQDIPLPLPKSDDVGAKTVSDRRIQQSKPQRDVFISSNSDTLLDHDHNRPRSDVDSMLTWVLKHGLSDRDIGYAVRRLAEIGTVEQMVALVTALRAEIRRASSRS